MTYSDSPTGYQNDDLVALRDADRVFLAGPCDTPQARAYLAATADRLRSWGFAVLTDADVLSRCGSRSRDSVEFARAAAEEVLASDAVALAPGWEHDAHAVATCEDAESLELAVVEVEFV